jgi:hypothetical protein
MRSVGIGVLIFGVIHIPLPQPDYHNIRHHDGPGELCVYHDHLLRWHPSASSDDDVSILHWHWFIPQREIGDHRASPSDGTRGPLSGPLLHAHLANCLAPDWPDELVTQLDGRCRFTDPLTFGTSTPNPALDSGALGVLDLAGRRSCTGGRESCDGLRAERIALFQRWNC